MDKGLIQSAFPASVPEALYAMLGSQVNSYHKHNRMGCNTSVSVELARELLESLIYTWQVSGGCRAGEAVEQAVARGRLLLEAKREEAVGLLGLVKSTQPSWQSEMRWDILRSLGVFLEQYDAAHLAHREPEILFYPLPVELPEGILGMDQALLYLRILRVENYILSRFTDAALEELWSRFCLLGWEESINPCVQAVTQALGKQLLGNASDSLLMESREIRTLYERIGDQEILFAAAAFARNLSEDARDYVEAVAKQLVPRLAAAGESKSLHNIFL